MIIGIRLLLLLTVAAIAILLIAYMFTRNPRFFVLTKLVVKVALTIAGLIGLLYVLERTLRW